jgi:protein-S-isoprenylcysteine O-methyltransferase Ste14
MTPGTAHTAKVIFGTLVVVGLVINFFERWFAPHMLLVESSPNFPAWLGWTGWVVAALAAVGYFVIDITN